ncbi:MAG: macro domain-containing protein [Candidatus Obscuribacterales bacterium]|jgi:O-acetyl-ADP-ribose deacetylase (regulator of RNase III)
MPLRIILGDKNPELIEAWTVAFAGVENVTVRGGNILLTNADALVSPANSFGFMDGGIDWSISELFEWKIQALVQRVIADKHAGELVVGAAEIIPTGNAQFKFLVCAPTMRTPRPVPDSINAFLAMRATLLAIAAHNKISAEKIESVAVPGMCTGVGRMPFPRSAQQMRAAYDLVTGARSNRYKSLQDACIEEETLRTISTNPTQQ